MVHLDIECLSHFAFIFAMCLQQHYDFLVISAVYILDGMIIVLCVSTLLFYSLEYSHFPL